MTNKVDIENMFTEIIKFHYEVQDGPLNVDGEQLFNDEWLAPINGCDTLQNLINDLLHALHEYDLLNLTNVK